MTPMKISLSSEARNRWLMLGPVVWSLLFVSCATIDRTVVAPPEVAGAEYVGDGKCAQCHTELVDGFTGATHAHLGLKDENGKAIGCETCHGPGSVHAKAGGGHGSIVNPGRSPEACFACHLDKRGEFSLPSTHPVSTGQMTCSDCHEPHAGKAVQFGGTQLAAVTDSCVQCHAMQSGPYVFEHEASREGCIACHSPHGSTNAKMLKARNQNLCLQCHFQEQTANGQIVIGGRNHASFINRGTCWIAGCHEAVHGSHVNSSLRF
jgi:predicted CXXCH cytochrome family protein